MDAARLFLAVPVADAAREKIRRLLPKSLPGRTVPPSNWHLTLRFLGQVLPDRLRVVVDALRDSALGLASTARLARVGAFPDLRRARVLWLGPAPGGEQALEELAASVDAALAAAGLPPRDRPFHAHLTLSRLRPPRDLRELAGGFRGGVDLPVGEVVLFRSVTGGDAPRYDPLERFALSDPR
jgi:RNA 2',3'-cyclic 3'-phosphodiesterase